MSDQLTVALCQMTSTDQPEKNLASIKSHIERGLAQGVECFFFPENSLYFRIEKGPIESSFNLNSDEIRQIDSLAQRNNIDIFLGSVPFSEEKGVSNSTVWLSPGEKPQKIYQKMHLFDVEVSGHKPVRESDDFLKGGAPQIINCRGWKLGLSICYDLRFSELYSIYAREEVDLILIPSAFLVPTGEAHWHVLNRARAIESQCYVISAAQGGLHEGGRGSKRSTYGHSLIVDPWGQILAESLSSDETPVVQLKRDSIEKVRLQIPMKSHRKL